MNTEYLIPTLISLIFLDLLLTIIRSSMVNAHLPRLLNLREEHVRGVDLTIQRMEKPRLRVSLRLSHSLLLILLAAVLVDSILRSHWLDVDQSLTPLYLVGITLLAGIILFSLESLIDGFVLKAPEEWALRCSGMAALIDVIVSPVSSIAIRLMGQTESSLQQITAPTDDELKTWVQQGQTDGALEKEERQMIYSIFQFGDTLAREIMVPRIDMLALDVTTGVDEATEALVKSGHSRVPVFEETVDNVIGLLYAKDLLSHLSEHKKISGLREVLRPAYFVPEAKKLDELLTEMQTKRVHMAIVVDEYGGVAGLVTLENLLEEIIGEIQDEYDQFEELPFQKVNDTEYVFLGSIDLDDFNEVMGTQITKDLADTLGGLMYGEIGRVPSGGEHVIIDGVELIVEQVLGRRIRKVRARSLADQPSMDEDSQNVDPSKED